MRYAALEESLRVLQLLIVTVWWNLLSEPLFFGLLFPGVTHVLWYLFLHVIACCVAIQASGRYPGVVFTTNVPTWALCAVQSIMWYSVLQHRIQGPCHILYITLCTWSVYTCEESGKGGSVCKWMVLIYSVHWIDCSNWYDSLFNNVVHMHVPFTANCARSSNIVSEMYTIICI